MFNASSFKITQDDTSLTTSFHEDIPAVQPPQPKRRRVLKKSENKELIKNGLSTSALPDSFQSFFRFREFNKMQSEAFPDLYETDMNCVISSPTGSGKTVLFELAIMRLIKETGDAIDNIKILYVAPTKSLCCERLKSWGPNFLNLTVGMLTSDTSYLETEKVRKCNIIITTPEKWDLLTRKWKAYNRLFELVKLILVDEIHTLRERRGATLEVVLTRMNIMCQSIRIIAISATIPNVEDISSWLRSKDTQERAKILKFDDSYRQVPLQKIVYGYSFYNKNDFFYDSMYNSKLDEILRMHSKNRPVLIFCPTRASTVSTAKYVVQNCFHLAPGSDRNADEQFHDQGLLECYHQNVAFHHAGLSIEDRTKVEQGFLEGKIKILCSTSTLAIGVNLPAYLVIIKGTRIWNTSAAQEYPQLDVLQMIGRAGRPDFENEGCAIIMTDSKMKQTYEKMLHGTDNLESSLHLELTEHLSAEISLGTISSTETAVNWLRNTFFYVRFSRNPDVYGKITKFMDHINVQDSQLVQFCEGILQNLLLNQIIEKQDDRLICTPYGYAMVRHYVLFDSTKIFINAPKSQSVQNILRLLSGSKEFTDIRIRHNEKRLYKEINSSPLTKFPFLTEKKQSQIIDTTFQKVSLLIQYELGGLEFPSYQGASKLHQTLVQDKALVFRNCFRILKCMVDAFIERKDGISLKNTLFLLRSVNGNCWEDSTMVLRQLKSIGLVSVRKLVHHDVNNLEQMRQISDQQIEYYLGQKRGSGSKIKRDLTLLPQLQVRCKLEYCSHKGHQLEVTLKIELSAQFETSIWHGQGLSLDIQTLKSTGELLDFRRLKLAHLKTPRSFRILTMMQLQSDSIEISINCLEVAGIGKSIQFSTKDLPQKFHETPPVKSYATVLDKCLIHSDSESDLEDSSLSSDDCLFQYLDKNPINRQINKEDVPDNRRVRSNGNFECNHACKDKSHCRHLCCKEGIPKELLRSKRAASTNHPAPDSFRAPQQSVDVIPTSDIKEALESDSSLEEIIPFQPETKRFNSTFEYGLQSVHNSTKPTTCADPNVTNAGAMMPQSLNSIALPSGSSDSNETDHTRLAFLGSDVDLN
ncbi:ZYRO0E09812p [Zygosaccharomyces rouxii]|uniref:DNA 3'-5' helicase n=1 Tax=Zygosaccharomyces rouxii (strain ATCC 2623 / CBS 732 / NBRC 1130 / NCYC 568 / NRRL Y-229) TaxID=559307 RepID=C5E4Y8_ZYGRC|nr:uncharacterized protein ZYRO0E09812g [Zygosaccharomyces rouxii]KAH9198046.1 Sec63 Brl domain-containing protein [Zygosaccharomyces rouxii]CAR31099.1 ZYRO0E09812p [Zygosaccharomyces rouxii]